MRARSANAFAARVETEARELEKKEGAEIDPVGYRPA